MNLPTCCWGKILFRNRTGNVPGDRISFLFFGTMFAKGMRNFSSTGFLLIARS